MKQNQTINLNDGLGPGPQVNPQAEQAQIDDIHVNTWDSMVNAFEKGFADNTIGNLSKAAYLLGEKQWSNSPILSDEQINNLKKDRPGLDIPQGTKSSVGQSMANEYDGSRWRSFIADHANPNLVTKGLDWLSAQPGNVADVVGIGAGVLAAAVGAPEEVAAGGAAVLGEMGMDELLGTGSSRVGSALLNRFVRGAKFGVGFSSAQEGGDIIKREEYNQPVNWVQSAWNIAQQGLMFGTIDTAAPLLKPIYSTLKENLRDVLNKFSPLTKEVDDTAKQTALAQMANGQDIDVTPVVKQGIAEQHQQLLNDLDTNNINPEEALAELDKSHALIQQGLETVPNDPDLLAADIQHSYVKSLLQKDPQPLSQDELDNHFESQKDPVHLTELPAPAPKNLKSPDDVLSDLGDIDLEKRAKELNVDDETLRASQAIEKGIKNQNVYERMVNAMTDCLVRGG